MRCWLCGVKPLHEIDTSALNSAFSTTAPGRWPPSTDGHTHAERPPTPAELEQAGHAALQRIRNEAIG